MASKKINRRRFIHLSAVAAAGAVVAGCAPQAPQVVEKVITSAPQVQEKVVTSAPQVVEKVVEKLVTAAPLADKYPPGKVTLWTWGTPQYQEDWMNDFLNIAYPGGKIKGVAQGTQGPDDIQKKVMLGFQAGGCADCADFIQNDPALMGPMVSAGALLDLTEWANTWKSKLPDGLLDDFTDGKGHVWAFTWRPNPSLIYYNRDVFEKAGVDPAQIKTWDDWYVAGTQIKKASNGNSFIEYRDGASGGVSYDLMVPQNGGRYFDENYNVTINTDPKTVEVFMYLEKMYKAGLYYMTSSWNPAWYQAQKDGKFAAQLTGNWWDEFLKKNLADMEGKWGLMEIPAWTANGTHKVPMTAVPFNILNKPKAPYVGLIMEMLEWQFLNKERVIEYLHLMTNRNLTAFLPVLKEVYTDPFFSTPDPYYKGQSFQAEVVKNTQGCPKNLPLKPDRLSMVSDIIGAEIGNVYAGKQDMRTALDNAAKGLNAKIEDIKAAP